MKKFAAEKTAETRTPLEVGDKVFLKRPPSSLAPGVSGTSKRLQSKLYTTLYEVKKVLSPNTVVLCNPDTGETDLGFGQPVSVERVVLHDLRSLETPVDSERPLRLEINQGGEWKAATLTHQSATGAVKVVFDGCADPEVLELQQEEYRWL